MPAFDLKNLTNIGNVAAEYKWNHRVAMVDTPAGKQPIPIMEIMFRTRSGEERKPILLTPDMILPVAASMLAWATTIQAAMTVGEVPGAYEGNSPVDPSLLATEDDHG